MATKSDQIREAIVEFMGEAGRRFQTRDISNSDIGKKFASSNISSALYAWVGSGMLVNGYALEESRHAEDGGRKYWQLKRVGGKPTEEKTRTPISQILDAASKHFAGAIMETKKDGSMLVRSGDRLWIVTPHKW